MFKIYSLVQQQRKTFNLEKNFPEKKLFKLEFLEENSIFLNLAIRCRKEVLNATNLKSNFLL